MHIQHFPLNQFGRDWAVSDIHGCFHLLERGLRDVNFDFSRDRLFVIGDSINRGLFSQQIQHYGQQPWFHACLGNHEDMILSNYQGWMKDEMLITHGGKWFVNLPNNSKLEIVRYFQNLPVAIEVETYKGLIGLVHAEVPHDSWDALKGAVAAAKTPYEMDYVRIPALWSKEKFKSRRASQITGVVHVYVGHSPNSEMLQLGNMTYIDGGCYKPEGRLNFVQINRQ